MIMTSDAGFTYSVPAANTVSHQSHCSYPIQFKLASRLSVLKNSDLLLFSQNYIEFIIF